MPKVSKRPSTYLYPLPTVLVTCGNNPPNIITIAWTGILSSGPPTLGIGVRPSRYSHGLIKESGEFVVNVPTAEQLQIVDYCGHVSGRDVDKWTETGLTPEPASAVKPPLIAQCPVNLECTVTHTLDLGTHDLFVGEIVAVHMDEAVLDDRGRLDRSKVNYFAFLGTEYWSLGEHLGTYGYSVKGRK